MQYLGVLKSYVNDTNFYNAFTEYLGQELTSHQLTLERSSEPKDFYREQGKIMALKKLIKMRDEINGASRQESLFK